MATKLKAVKIARKTAPKKPVGKANAPSTKDQPSLESILEKADIAYTNITRNCQFFGELLVQAITYYGNVGKKEFRTRYPLTDNALRNLELVGRGRLLPQFALDSDKFVTGLVNMDDSLMWQHKLIGASRNGTVMVRWNGRIISVPFGDFRSGKLAGAVLTLLSESDRDLTVDQLGEKLRNLDREVRAKFNHKPVKLYEIRLQGAAKVVRFLKVHTYTAEDLKAILAKLED